MIRSLLLCVVVAALLHLAVLLFGGAIKFLFVKPSAPEAEKLQEVEVVEEKKEEEKPEEKKQVEKVAEAEEEPLPDTSVIEAMEQQQQAPALANVSLADLESALGGGGASGGGGFNFASGGVIGGAGAPGSGGGVDALMGGAGAMTKPRVVSSQQPDFPAAIKRAGGSVALVVWVGEDGRVRKVSVESASDPALEQPAIQAVQRWMFEPATYQGRKVPGKVRQVIRLSPPGT